MNSLRKNLKFLGNRVIAYLLLGIVAGFGMFILEVGFAYGLQAFLVTLGIANANAILLPKFIPSSGLVHVLSFVLIVGIIKAAVQGIQIYLQGAVLEEFRYLQRSRIISWVFQSKNPGTSEVISLFNECATHAGNGILALQSLIVYATTVVFLCIKLFTLSPFLTLSSLALMFFLLLPLKILSRRLKHSSQNALRNWEKTNETLIISLKNLLLMRIYGTENIEEQKTQLNLASFRGNTLENQLGAALRFGFPQAVGVLLVCLQAILSTHTVLSNPAILVTYFYLFVRFSLASSNIFHLSSLLSASLPQIRALKSWWTVNFADTYLSLEKSARIPSTQIPFEKPLGWNLKDIHFRYDHAHRKALSPFNLIIEPGATCVIMGPSGAGKSTLLNIILGMIIPQSGTVKIQSGATVISNIDDYREQILKHIGYVGPESFIIQGSIYKNLVYGLSFTPSEHQIQEALNLAECQFVYSLPNQLNHSLTEQGVGLSAGQKQRLSLARALLRQPKALILDEATANLDSELESKLIQTLKALKHKMTIVAVTHREALLTIADQQVLINEHGVCQIKSLNRNPGHIYQTTEVPI